MIITTTTTTTIIIMIVIVIMVNTDAYISVLRANNLRYTKNIRYKILKNIYRIVKIKF